MGGGYSHPTPPLFLRLCSLWLTGAAPVVVLFMSNWYPEL